MRRARKTIRAWSIPGLVLGLTGVYLAVILVAPLGALLHGALSSPAGVWRSLSRPEPLHAMGMTLIVTLLTVAVSAVIGVLGGMVLARHRFPGRGLVDLLIDLPIALSPVVIGLAFLLLFGRQGALGGLLDSLGVKVAFAVPGVVIATLFVTLPLTVREVALLLVAQGTSEEDAAFTLGASPWQVFRWVMLPNVTPALVAGTLMTTARSLGEFGAVLVLGGAIALKTSTATTFVHLAIEERDLLGAYGMSVLLAALTIALVAALGQRAEH